MGNNPKGPSTGKNSPQPKDTTQHTTSFKKDKGLNTQTSNLSEIKMILLGSGESGKSTIFKQIKRLNEQKFTKEELSGFKNPIYRNILIVTKSCLKSALKRFPENTFSLEHSKEYCDYILNLMPNEEEIDEFEAGRIYTKETYKAITELWKEKKYYRCFFKL